MPIAPRLGTATPGWPRVARPGQGPFILTRRLPPFLLPGGGRRQFDALEFEVCGSPGVQQLVFFDFDPWIILSFNKHAEVDCQQGQWPKY